MVIIRGVSKADGVCNPMKKLRLNTFIARTGLCSRRKADVLIAEGKIAVNGETITELGSKVDPEKDTITCRGEVLRLKQTYTYILLHKPEGYITTSKDERGRKIVLDLLPEILREKRLFSVGRLDRDSTGLLILTDDGELANQLMHPRNLIEKRYEVRITKPIEADHVKRLLIGIRDAGDILKAQEVKPLSPTKLEVVLTEGKKREIRRMLGGLGYGVAAIKRTHFAFLTTKGLEEGNYRKLTKREIARLRSLS